MGKIKEFQRICAHRGKKRAIVAVAHSMLIAIYQILKDNVSFHDLGSDYFNQFNRERKINSLLKKLKQLFLGGYDSHIHLNCLSYKNTNLIKIF